MVLGVIAGEQMLLEAKAEVNLSSQWGFTALHAATFSKIPSVGCVAMLVRAGAVVDAKGSEGETALQFAIQNLVPDCAEYLFAAGAKLSNLKQAMPSWFVQISIKHNCCRRSARTFYGVLRKRWTVHGSRVPRDMINLLTRMIWDSRMDKRWDSAANRELKFRRTE